MAEQFANRAQSQLDGSILSGATTLTVDDGSVFPSSGNFRILVDAELMLCTSRSGNILTVTRAIESTSATSHADEAPVRHVLTVASLYKFVEQMIGTGTFASRPATGVAGRIYYPTDAPWITHCRDTGSTWENFWNGLLLSTPPSSGSWTVHNAATGTWTHTKDAIQLTLADSANTAHSVYKRSSTYTAPTKVTIGGFLTQGRQLSAPTYSAAEWGLALLDGSGKYVCGAVISEKPGGVIRPITIGWYKFTSVSVFSAAYFDRDSLAMSQPIFLQIEDDNTNRIFRYSTDGINFTNLYTTTRTDFLTADVEGFFGLGRGSIVTIFHYKRE